MGAPGAGYHPRHLLRAQHAAPSPVPAAATYRGSCRLVCRLDLAPRCLLPPVCRQRKRQGAQTVAPAFVAFWRRPPAFSSHSPSHLPFVCFLCLFLRSTPAFPAADLTPTSRGQNSSLLPPPKETRPSPLTPSNPNATRSMMAGERDSHWHWAGWPPSQEPFCPPSSLLSLLLQFSMDLRTCFGPHRRPWSG